MRPGDNADATVWEANFPAYFRWADWADEEESVFFHQGSGETLLLNPLGAFLLKTIAAAPISTKALAQRAATRFDLSADQSLATAIGASLHVFAQKGLIFRSAP